MNFYENWVMHVVVDSGYDYGLPVAVFANKEDAEQWVKDHKNDQEPFPSESIYRGHTFNKYESLDIHEVNYFERKEN